MHRSHPELHEAGLQDDCARCAELAENPVAELDQKMLTQLIELAIHPDRLGRARSENEAIASAKVLTLLEKTGRMFEVAPQPVAHYLRDRWHVPVVAGPGLTSVPE